ncbi:MAG: T9SS type A sorting domain-containing protein, partial [Candidatus Krumholzibacteria bacterium]|nr:T9SS type A sorting domain-containing protein [Candidatus Krumholzibacteria bacterium]
WFEREGLVESMSLSQDEVEFMEEMFLRLNLTPEMDTALRIALHGISDPASAPGLPRAFTLEQNFPNPFNGTTTIFYSVAELCDVEIRIYDTAGRLVRILERKQRGPGRYRIIWNGKGDGGQDVSSGVYFCRIKAGKFRQTRKILYLR